MLRQEHEEPTYKPQFDEEHDPPHATTMVCAEIERMIEVGLWQRVGELIRERFAGMKTVVSAWVPSDSLQDWSETRSTIMNIADSSLSSSIKKVHVEDLIGKLLARMGYTKDTIHEMTCNTFRNVMFIALVAGFVKHKT